jgi:hypothetical protein
MAQICDYFTTKGRKATKDFYKHFFVAFQNNRQIAKTQNQKHFRPLGLNKRSSQQQRPFAL